GCAGRGGGSSDGRQSGQRGGRQRRFRYCAGGGTARNAWAVSGAGSIEPRQSTPVVGAGVATVRINRVPATQLPFHAAARARFTERGRNQAAVLPGQQQDWLYAGTQRAAGGYRWVGKVDSR